jgi:hypothetical protein
LHKPEIAVCRSFQEQLNKDRSTTAEAFLLLLKTITHTTNAPTPGSIDTPPSLAVVFNCSFDDLTLFARELGITDEQFPQEIHLFCHK